MAKLQRKYKASVLSETCRNPLSPLHHSAIPNYIQHKNTVYFYTIEIIEMIEMGLTV